MHGSPTWCHAMRRLRFRRTGSGPWLVVGLLLLMGAGPSGAIEQSAGTPATHPGTNPAVRARVRTRVWGQSAVREATAVQAWQAYGQATRTSGAPARRVRASVQGGDAPSADLGNHLGTSLPVPRYSDADSTVPPVLLDLDEEPRSLAEISVDSETGEVGESEHEPQPIRPLPAELIRSYPPAIPGGEEITSQLEASAENAFLTHPVEPPLRRLQRSGVFWPGLDGRLERSKPVRLPARTEAWDADLGPDEIGKATVVPVGTGRVRARITSAQEPPLPPPVLPGLVTQAQAAEAVPEFSAAVAEREPANVVPAPRAERSPLQVEEEFKPIGQLGLATHPVAGDVPENVAAARFSREGEAFHGAGYSRPGWMMQYCWEAPALCHRPLLFEEVNLERHGYETPWLQPVISGAHFFVRVPVLPYLMVSQDYLGCTYTLGHYRPGSCAPYLWYYPQFSAAGLTLEGAVVTGLILAIP